jgi:integrase/recombinase XerC
MTTHTASQHSDGMEMIDEYLKHLARESCTEATIASRREILTRLHRQLPHGIGHTCQDELEEWLHDERWEAAHPGEQRWTQNTKATYWTALKSFYTWAADPSVEGLGVNEDPTLRMTPVRTVRGEARPVEDDQLWRLLDEARQPYRLWALIAAYQGLRCIEISRLDREDITEKILHVVKGKGGRPRTHDTDPLVWEAVRDLPPGPIAVDQRTGERATAFYVSSTAAVYFRRRLHMPGVSLHRLRHWLGCTVQERYQDIRVTQEVLGHTSLQSTQIYTRATPARQRAARAMLPRPRAA